MNNNEYDLKESDFSDVFLRPGKLNKEKEEYINKLTEFAKNHVERKNGEIVELKDEIKAKLNEGINANGVILFLLESVYKHDLPLAKVNLEEDLVLFLFKEENQRLIYDRLKQELLGEQPTVQIFVVRCIKKCLAMLGFLLAMGFKRRK